jgi:hypothetical protein
MLHVAAQYLIICVPKVSFSWPRERARRGVSQPRARARKGIAACNVEAPSAPRAAHRPRKPKMGASGGRRSQEAARLSR